MLDNQKKFEILFNSLKEAYKEHIDNGVKIVGILLVVVGWFTVSDNPLPLLCGNTTLVVIALASVVFGEVALIFLTAIQYKKSKSIYDYLVSIEEDARLYRGYALSKPMMVGSIFGHFIILFGIFFLIYGKYIETATNTCKVIGATT